MPSANAGGFFVPTPPRPTCRLSRGGFIIGERNDCFNDNFKPTKLLSFTELTTTRGITFSRRHLKRLEDERKFPLRVVLGENRIGWVVTGSKARPSLSLYDAGEGHLGIEAYRERLASPR
jgi:predicted DNA-binding transcriptional regulator AlpA